MHPISLKCPNCGAPINRESSRCEYCRSTIDFTSQEHEKSEYEQEQRRLAAESYASRQFDTSVRHWENALLCSPEDITARLRMYQCAVMLEDCEEFEEDILSTAYNRLVHQAPKELKAQVISAETRRTELEDEIFDQYSKSIPPAFKTKPDTSLRDGGIILISVGSLGVVAALVCSFVSLFWSGPLSAWSITIASCLLFGSAFIFPGIYMLRRAKRKLIQWQQEDKQKEEACKQAGELMKVLTDEAAALKENILAMDVS